MLGAPFLFCVDSASPLFTAILAWCAPSSPTSTSAMKYLLYPQTSAALAAVGRFLQFVFGPTQV